MKRVQSYLLVALLLCLSLIFFSPQADANTEVEMQPVTVQDSLNNKAESATTTSQQSTKIVEIILFSRPDCIHCIEEKEFLTELKQKRSDFIVTDYDITNPEHSELWQELTSKKKIPKATPVTIVHGKLIQGFDSSESTGIVITQQLDKAIQASEVISLETFLATDQAEIEQVEKGQCGEVCEVGPEPLLVSIPFVGAVNVRQYSLPVLAALLGFVDGFNPCAMWVLVSFLIILTQIGDRKKMWLFAGTFILAEAIMYFLILNVWYTTWDFIGLDRYVTPIVGLVALGSGLFFLWEAKNNDGSCKVTDGEQKYKTQQKLKSLVEAELSVAVFLGILGLALSVNIIEFACSIGIPQAFTKILELQNFTFWQSLPYNLLYILMYMVDDFVVFGVALYSFERIGVTTKYTRVSQVIGGIVMLALGALLLFWPEALKMI